MSLRQRPRQRATLQTAPSRSQQKALQMNRFQAGLTNSPRQRQQRRLVPPRNMTCPAFAPELARRSRSSQQPDDNGVAAANNEKPGSTRQNSASGSAEWSPDRRSTPASTTSNDGTAKRFAVKGKPLQASDSKPQLANLAAPQGRCVISLVFCLILVTITS